MSFAKGLGPGSQGLRITYGGAECSAVSGGVYG